MDILGKNEPFILELGKPDYLRLLPKYTSADQKNFLQLQTTDSLSDPSQFNSTNYNYERPDFSAGLDHSLLSKENVCVKYHFLIYSILL